MKLCAIMFKRGDEMLKEKTCCFTGHRILGKDFTIQSLDNAIEYMINKGVTIFICGGAIGFDTYAEEAVLRAKERHEGIELHIYVPCNNQNAKWNISQKSKYNEILQKADRVDMVDRPYYEGCMKERNYKMVDNSSYCIAYFHESESRPSGTGQTFRYAKRQGLEILNLGN